MRPAFLTLALFVSLLAVAVARDARQQARIDFLLHEVETARDATFIRNGTDHDAKAAADHLRMKLKYAGERVKTAEDFIKGCASESSITHRKYRVRLPDGKTLDAGDYLTEKLHEFDRGKQ